MSAKFRLVVCVVVAIAARSHRASAATSVITMTPNPLDVGNVLLNATGTATGTMGDNNPDRVDLALTTSCTGAGMGTFAITSPTLDVDLTTDQSVTITYVPTVRGQRKCRVDVKRAGTGSVLGSFDVRGTGQKPATFSGAATLALGATRFNDAAPVHTASANYTVTNTGDVDLSITDVQIGGANAADFAITLGGTVATILPNNTATWTITFDPAVAGPSAGTLTFTSNDAASPKVVTLSGTGTTAIIGVDDPAFGIVNIGSSSSRDITVKNNGTGTKGNLGVTTAVISGGSWFAFSACGGGTSCTFVPALAIATQVAVGVKCSPSGPIATQTATVTFTSDTDDAAGTPDTVASLSCTGGQGKLVTTAANETFAGQLVTTTSAGQTVTVTNTGNIPASFYLVLTGAGAPSFHAAAVGGCGTNAGNPCNLVATTGTVDFTITFAPQIEGDISAGLDLVSTSVPYPQLALAGRGLDRHILMAPTMMFPDTFRNPGDRASVLGVKVNNVGEYPLHVSSLTVAGDPLWTLVDPNDPFDVPGLGSHDVMVRFAPVSAGKAPEGMLMVASDDRTTANTVVVLQGNGKDRNVQMAPSSIDFGDTGAGVPTRLSAIKSGEMLSIASMDGMNTFRIREIKIEGDPVFEVQDADGNVVSNLDLPPSTTAQFDIVFKPPTLGEFHANVTLFLDQDTTAQTSIAVRGRALFVDAHGGGGCSTGRGGSGGMVLVLGAVLAGLRRRRAAAVVAGVLAVPLTASAEPTRNIDLTVFDPTPSTAGSSFQLQSADVGANGDYAATALASFASNPLVLGTVQNDDPVVRRQTMMSIGGAYAFGDRFEAGARMPLYIQSGDTVPQGMLGVPPASGAARGDLTLHAKARLVHTPRLSLAASLSIKLPTATDSEFAGADKPSARVLALASVMASRQLTLHVNAGGVIRATAEFANISQRSGLAVGAGASLRVLAPLFLTAEVFGDVIPSGYHAEPAPMQTTGATSTLMTIEGLAGARWQASRQLSIGLAAGRGLTSGIGAPDVRGVFTLAYAPSAAALPPLHAVIVEAPIDPSKADTDHDRIPDAVDKCPLEPEDKDGFEDSDGCPDPDNDKDGVPDEADKCPLVAEDKDGFEDSDGCPEADNDKDGIPDATDKCPNEPETINGIDDDDGCPDKGDKLVISSPDRLELLESIEFTGSTVAKKSASLLGQLGATLRARGDIVRIRITAHVQPTGRPDQDQALSEARARAVRDELVQWGIATERLEIKGLGGTKPLVPAAQKGSALLNNRIELIILERK